MKANDHRPSTAQLVVAAAGMVIVATVSWVLVLGDSESEQFCTMDAMVAENLPDGWEFSRDGMNDCAWTLFNEDGDRAPDSLYAGTGVEPPDNSISPGESALLAVAVTSTLGLLFVFLVAILRQVEHRGGADE